ncbi:Penicillin-binding protein F [Hartmannibacter diazotrophicus]|uniref:Penicillin-binding protein F n=1 Tax=Hartmannibacter diazotrophicus TaxID=1482074 RepID=A0A2C9D3R9_9HYPH|nr:PBP1A family penicillin-binding protein [Hartmannibacter diazotrophicus]SON54873.1 Penicillin-binding protein F [Hartmannibacter diazotrophicus]
MTNPETAGKRKSLSRRLLAIDAWIDTSAWRIGQAIRRALSAYSEFLGRFRVTGASRGLNEFWSEAATLGTAGAVVLLAFAQPAMQATNGDYLAKSDYAVTFLDRQGREIGRRGLFLDDSVPLDDFPDALVKATLATEDRRFFDHYGIDAIGTLRALTENLRANGVVQGGSSITQQLAKNLFLSNERSLQRKIKEAYLALWLEANLSKREILKLYLDRAYMGGGTYGVTAAARFYFDKPVTDLTLAESAMLAGLYKAPTKYAPHVDLAAARARANQVLSNLVDAGFMTEGEVAGARRRPAGVAAANQQAAPDWFLDWAFEEVKRIGPTDSHTLVVRTTLDAKVQKAAEEAVATNLRQHGAEYNVTEVATVVQDPEGAVRAMVGGRDYGVSQFNRAVDALRQPGSAFKPFVYATAFLNGYHASSVINDAPLTIGNWSPRNYGRSYAGAVTLKTALTRSINTVPVRLAQAIGRDKIVKLTHRLGVRSDLRITRSLPLGTSEVSVLDMTGAYATFATGGIATAPYAIDEIATSDGKILYRHDRDAQPPRRVLPAAVAAELNDSLANVVAHGTARRAIIEGVPAAGKTGTTQSYRDAWFVGFTGNYVATVWYGNDDFSSTKRMTGGSLPAQTWHDIMAPIHAGLQPRPIPGVDGASDMPDAIAGLQPVQSASPLVELRTDRLSAGGLTVIADIGQLMDARRQTLVAGGGLTPLQPPPDGLAKEDAVGGPFLPIDPPDGGTRSSTARIITLQP